MKIRKKIWLTLIIVAILIGVIIGEVKKALSNSVVTMTDIMATINEVKYYFIPLIVLLILFLIGLFVFRHKNKKFKFWFKWESVLTLLVAFVLTINTIIFIPMGTLFNLQYAQLNGLKQQTLTEGTKVSNKIGDEGTVLLKNKQNYLPLNKSTKKINVFGWASTNPVYGGGGSGSVNLVNATSILKSLSDAGFQTNTQLSKFYSNYRKTRPTVSMMKQDWTLPEPKTSAYSSNMMKHAENFSNTAMVVISRVSTEGVDEPTDMSKVTYHGNRGDFKSGDSYLQLSRSEKNLLKMVNQHFKNVIILVNSGNPMQLGWLNHYSHIKSALWMADPGTSGFSALGKIIKGQVDPSGRTTDTFVYNLKKTPTWNNFGNFSYKNPKGYHYVDYSEGIYSGYKFYETYYQNNENKYHSVVQYPFGYGLSYAKFKEKMSNLRENGQKLKFTVKVKNTGKYSGKDVVEIYDTPPYYNGGIEKAATNLVEFAKTKNLKPNQTQTLHFSVNKDDLASYDTKADHNKGAYVLDKGAYQLQVKANAHQVVDSRTFKLDHKIVYSGSNKRSSDKVAASNQFNFAKGNVTYLSRANNFANYQQATAKPKKASMTKQQIATTKDLLHNDVKRSAGGQQVKTKNENIKLNKLRGKSFNDPLWKKFINQLSAKEIAKIVTYGGYQTLGDSKYGIRHAYNFDGPAGISSFFVKLNTTAYPCASMIASTWNKQLAYQRGKSIGKEASDLGISGWYGPGMNLHRSAFSGRNYEYYSEDGTLSGFMGENEVKGAASKGVYAYIKQFALNDQETNRLSHLVTWANEQSIRENYLKPFEMSVKTGKARAVMSSLNYIGNQWAGGSKALLTNVLRKEWGFHGAVITDYFGGYGYMDANLALAAGGTSMLSTTGQSGSAIKFQDNNQTIKELRKATHENLYTLVNSNAYKDKNASYLLPWQKKVYQIDALIAVILIGIQIVVIYIYRKRYLKE